MMCFCCLFFFFLWLIFPFHSISDGWDRTSQLSCLSQLLVEPRYRTIDGFHILIDKDWVAFGHMFTKRCIGTGGSKLQTPIFLQFLDCVWQIMRQHPSRFEFNENLLLILAEEAYAQWTGTFIADSEKERRQMRVTSRCMSVWDVVACNRPTFVSPLFEPPARTQELTIEALRIRCEVSDLAIWMTMHCK
jgi:hypothetical protein